MNSRKKIEVIRPTLLALAIASAPWAVQAQSASTVQILSPVVVTAPVVVAPLVVETDPRAPRQPLPANDGADFLKSIPGFSVIRKGGTDGDPVFRGQAGSRLGILLDGQEVYGGCGGRMDPPTAYVYPESYDNVRVLKGPQSVLYGAGWSAGVALFERNFERFEEFGYRGRGSLTFGSAARNDQVADFTVGNSQFYARAGGSRAHSNDYEDGDGNTVHSAYRRWNTYGAVGWTPDDNTRLELSAALSDGEAAYADRSMDGSKFRRENVSLYFEKRNITQVLSKVEARVYHNYVDHVMDNYSLREKPATGMYSAMNPDRRTQGGRFSATLTPSDDWQVTLGADFRHDRHRGRMGMGMTADIAEQRYRNAERGDNLTFRQMGLFGEAQYELDAQQRLIGGLRVDWHEVEDKRAASELRGQKDKRTLPSGFLRYESDFAGGYWYAGLGHAERFPDFWERMKVDEFGEKVTLKVKPEKLTQLDIGTSYSNGPLTVAVSGFYGHVADYVSLDWSGTTTTRNIDARIMGGEVDASYRFNPNWLGTATLAYVFGQNRTDDRPLAQQPPLELRLGLNYEQGDYSVGALWRLAARQNRYDLNQGNLVGRDSGPSAGFGVLSLNAGWRAHPAVLVTAGIDNLLDKTYSEHLSRTGTGAVGFWPANVRINEPGRTFWLKMQAEF